MDITPFDIVGISRRNPDGNGIDARHGAPIDKVILRLTFVRLDKLAVSHIDSRSGILCAVMELIATEIPDVKVLVPKKFGDERGFFSETFNRKTLSKLLGQELDFVQDNHAFSAAKGVVRGLHYQLPPMAQGKLVRVTAGRSMMLQWTSAKRRRHLGSTCVE